MYEIPYNETLNFYVVLLLCLCCSHTSQLFYCIYLDQFICFSCCVTMFKLYSTFTINIMSSFTFHRVELYIITLRLFYFYNIFRICALLMSLFTHFFSFDIHIYVTWCSIIISFSHSYRILNSKQVFPSYFHNSALLRKRIFRVLKIKKKRMKHKR